MNKNNKNIDYGASFQSLKRDLIDTERELKEKQNEFGAYAYAYGRATMAIKLHLIECTGTTFDEIQKETNPEPAPTLERYLNNPDDLPKELFTKP